MINWGSVNNMMLPYKIPDTALGYINGESMVEKRSNYFSLLAYFRPQLDNYVQYFFLSWKRIIDKVEWVQKRATKMIKDLENEICKGTLRKLACSNWKKDNREAE